MYQIDQSIKIENTNKTTYVCLANGRTLVVSITAKEKHYLKLYFRKLHKPLIFKLFTFSVLCAKTILKIKPGSVTIDREYYAHERQIKSFILQILRIKNAPEPIIHFSQIGKHSSAHVKVYSAMHQKAVTAKVTSLEILQLYEKINKK